MTINKIINLLLIVLAVVLSGCIKTDKQEQIISMEITHAKKAVLIIAQVGFQDFEYQDTRKALEYAGIEIIVASLSKNKAVGKFGQEVDVDLSLDQIQAQDFDALVFIGGPGARDYIDNSIAHDLAWAAVNNNKVLGAICIAPTVLAKAGVLQGKKATVWSDKLDKSSIEILENQGAEYIDQAVVVDGNLVTANGPSAAQKFGQAIVKLIK